MPHSKGQQGQFSLRKALTAATTGGHGYMKRCYDNMRSELTEYGGIEQEKSYLLLPYTA